MIKQIQPIWLAAAHQPQMVKHVCLLTVTIPIAQGFLVECLRL